MSAATNEPPATSQTHQTRSVVLTVIALIACVGMAARWPDNAAPFSLGLGVVLALGGLVESKSWGKTASKYLIQICVVLLGFTMDFNKVMAAGLSGLAFAAGTIVFVFSLGWVLGRLLKTDSKITTLVSSGTAICGGSAIAAVSSVIGSSAAQTSVALATIFILNGVALYLFPPLGKMLHLTDNQFGTWAAVAIHDVSSVIGAARSFSEASIETATTVKLSRALWIIPVCCVCGIVYTRKAQPTGSPDSKPAFPWFILAFIGACALATQVTIIREQAPLLKGISRVGLCIALFLIGASLNRKAIAQVGWRALVLGIALWVAMSITALLVVRATVV